MTFRFSPSPWLVRAAQLGIFAGLVGLLWWATDWREAVSLLKRADPRWLAAAVLMLTLQTVLSAQRWRITAAQLGITIQPGAAVREYYLAQIVNQSLPGGMVGDAGRAVRARGDAGLLVSGQAVLFERLTGQMALLAVLITGLALTLVIPIGIDWPLWLITPILGALAILAGVVLGGAGVLWVMGPSDHVFRRFLDAFRHAVLARNIWMQQVGLSFGTVGCNLAAFAFCAHALGVTMPVLVVATFVPLILFAMILPLSIGGWGFREGAATLLFPVIGATASEGLATSVAFGLVYLVTVLPGVLLPLARRNAPAAGRR